MATENQSRPAVTPFAAAPPPVMTPFGSSGPVASRPDGVAFRSPGVPPNLVSNGSIPFSSAVPLAKSVSPAFRPSPPGRFVPSTPAPPGQPPSNVPPTSNNFHHFSAPRFPSQPQAPPVGMFLTRPPNMPPSVQPNLLQRPGVPAPTPPLTFSSLPQTPSFQTASPPQASPYFVQQPGNVQPPLQPVFPAIQQPRSAPPMSSMQGLIEDFNSLSLGAVPGSRNSGLNSEALPRPLDGDVEPSALSEVYPMNCNPRYFRLTTSGIPHSQSLASRWHLPLGAVVCPLAVAPEGEEVPVVNFGSAGIIRCRRCRTYVNPYVTFTDGGTKWRCNMCALQNDVSGNYFAQLDPTGRRVDADQRPELTRGSVEFVAPTEYMVRPPMPPLYFFLIDVSVSAVRSGLLEVVAQTIKSCLDELPGFPRTQIGFITYDSNIHFYNMKSTLTQPQMMVISDVEDIFIPLPDDLRVILSESRKVVESFLDSLPSMFQGTTNVESAFGPALRAAFMIMSQLGGKLLIFQNTLPSIGIGRLRLHGDNPVAYGTNKEPSLRVAEDSFYKHMAADFTKYQIGVDVYACSDNYTDLASLGTLSKYTGGQVYHYPSFQSNVQGEKLRHELTRDLIRETAWEAVMRIRCGKGVRFNSYHGNFMLRSTDLLALPAVDCDKAFAMQLSLEETLLTNQTVYFQVALLYTASCGERRIRVHTAAAPVVSELGEMYSQADTGAIVSLLGRIAIEKSLSGKLEDSRNYLQLKIVKSLREYRSLYSVQHRLAGRMIYPESLKYLPLYGLALCKSIALRGGHADEPLDERCAVGSKMMTLPVKNLLKFLYPSLIRVDELLLQASSSLKDVEKRLPLAQESLDPRGLYILDNGFDFVIWIGKFLSSDITTSLNITFDLLECKLIDSGSEMSRRLVTLFNKMRESDPAYYQLSHFVMQGEQHKEMYFLLANLIEDQTRGITGYADWIMLIHRQVLQNA